MLCTDSFTLEEVNFLRDILLKKYKIESTINSRGEQLINQYRIRIPKKSTIIVQILVRDYIHVNRADRVGL